MKTSETEIITLAIFALSTLTSAVLTGYEYKDITRDTRFGCSWSGGVTTAVNCTCRDDAGEMFIEENSILSYDTSTVEINNCKQVRFGSRSIAEMRNLRTIILRNIDSLIFDQSSLVWYTNREKSQYEEERYDVTIPSLQITIEDCTIPQISKYTFQGRINKIYFNRVTINTLEPFAFYSLVQSGEIIIKDSTLKEIPLQPFKKFDTKIFELDGVKASLIPSRFISNITVSDRFTIKNCFFETVRSGGFVVYNPRKFEVINTKIDQLDGEAFKVTTRGDVLFKNNIFGGINDGAFSAIELNRDEVVGANLIFDSNSFSRLTRNSLSVSDSFTAEFSNLNINESCDCHSIDHKIKDSDFYSEIKCLHEGEFVTVREFKSDMCSIIQSYSTPIIIGAVVFTLLVITGIALMVYYRKVYLSRKYGNEKNSTKANNNLSLIVPDGRTYRETELHVIVERADLLTTDL